MAAEEELNCFLRSHRVVSVQKQLVVEGGTAYWCFCVEFLLGQASAGGGSKGRSRVDYKEVLSEADFAAFARLRDARKQLATEEAIPVYAVAFRDDLDGQVCRLRKALLEGSLAWGPYSKFCVRDPRAPCLNACGLGMTFLGYRIFPGQLRLSRRSRDRFRRRLREDDDHLQSGVWSEVEAARYAEPLLEFVRRADSRAFLERVSRREDPVGVFVLPALKMIPAISLFCRVRS